MPRSLLPLLRLPVLVAALATFGSVGCKGGSAPAKKDAPADAKAKGSAESPAKEGKADGARFKFEVIDGADHFFLDLFAEDVADHMEEFLGSGS